MPDELVARMEITTILPCLADSTKIRFHAQASADLTEALPYLNAVIQRAIYNHSVPALTYTEEHRIICVHPRLITGAKLDDIEDARAILESLRQLINETWDNRATITPSYDRREKLTPLAVFRLLPRTNCRRCGLPTCLAFATELAAERRSVVQCPPLFEAASVETRRLLCAMLTDAGYEVPFPFRETAPD
ncbi:MAG: (Fe-S)-binding protein [Armatimonadota bacterium]